MELGGSKRKDKVTGDERHTLPGSKVAKTMIEAGITGENEANHFTVDWDGPDDPNNPKKSGLPGTDCDLRLKSPPAAGRSAKNGS